MAEKLDEEGIFPSGALDFSLQGRVVGMTANDVEGEPSQGGEVLRGIVLSGPVGVLGKDDVEDPVQVVFDAPMTAQDLQGFFGRHVSGQQIVLLRHKPSLTYCVRISATRAS